MSWRPAASCSKAAARRCWPTRACSAPISAAELAGADPGWQRNVWALTLVVFVAFVAAMGLVTSVGGDPAPADAPCPRVSALPARRRARSIPAAQLLMLGLLLGGPLCAAMALAQSWPTLLVLRTLAGFCLGGAVTLAYVLGAQIVPAETRGAAFGWLALGLQFGTAASPLVTGALAAVSLTGAYVFDGALAWTAAALLAFGAHGLRTRNAVER